MRSWRGAGRRMAVVAGGLALAAGRAAAAAPDPIEIRVVVVTAFEVGEDTGDAPGEFQAWAQEMPETLPFPAGYRRLRYDPARKTLAVMTGMGTNRAATSILALGLDPRFDVSHAYWVVAAIAGVNPEQGSIGSAAWIGDVIDTDFAYVVDPRELPAGWATGFMPYGRKQPYAQPPSAANRSYNLFSLNRGLRDWAYARTRSVALPDSPALQKGRAGFAAYPNALKPPSVMTGDEVSGQGFWHGRMLNAHADAWARYWAGPQARFVMTGMEDTGVVQAIGRLEAAGRADSKRVLVLRAGSNYSVPPSGQSAVSEAMGGGEGYSGARAAFFAAHAVARPVVDELADHWDRYRAQLPSGGAD